MEIERIKEFVIIAEKKSIKEAAASLSLSAATLSSRLLNFERNLGVDLFVRNGKALTLSPEGERFYEDAVAIVNRYETLKEALLHPEEKTDREERES